MHLKYKFLIYELLLLLVIFLCGIVGVYLALKELNLFITSLIAGFVQLIKSITELLNYGKQTIGEVAYKVQVVDINDSKKSLSNFAKFIIELMKILALLNIYNNYISLLGFILIQYPFKLSKDENEWTTLLLFMFQKKYTLYVKQE